MKDNRLCMGLASSPYVFSKLSDFIVCCAVREGVTKVVNYLDDYCIISPTAAEGCQHQATVIAILRRIGFFVSFKKLRAPNTTVRFLGIDIYSVALEMRLPEDKLAKLMLTLDSMKGRSKTTRRELERLGGILAHCSKVVRGGRTFCRRIYDAINSIREPHHKVRLAAGLREDVDWWCGFAACFNGKAKILGCFAAHISTYSNASNFGYGAMHGGTGWQVPSVPQRMSCCGRSWTTTTPRLMSVAAWHTLISARCGWLSLPPAAGAAAGGTVR